MIYANAAERILKIYGKRKHDPRGTESFRIAASDFKLVVHGFCFSFGRDLLKRCENKEEEEHARNLMKKFIWLYVKLAYDGCNKALQDKGLPPLTYEEIANELEKAN